MKECAVIGVPDEATGEAVKAFIVCGDPTLDAAACATFARVNSSTIRCRNWLSSVTNYRSRMSANFCARTCVHVPGNWPDIGEDEGQKR